MPDPRPLLPRLLNRLRSRGAAEVAGVALDRVREQAFSNDVLIMFVRDAGGEEPDRDDLRLREATRADADRYARDIGSDSWTTFADRLTPSTQCYVVELDGRLAHASWVTTDRAWTRELRRYIHPPSGDAYIYESFTRADARGRGVYPFALMAICARHSGRTKRLWVAIDADNPASLKAVAKAGFAEAFRLPYGRRLGTLRIGVPSGPLAALATDVVLRNTGKALDGGEGLTP